MSNIYVSYDVQECYGTYDLKNYLNNLSGLSEIISIQQEVTYDMEQDNPFQYKYVVVTKINN